MMLFLEVLTITFAVLTGITMCQCVTYTCTICACSMCAASTKYKTPSKV
jgi:hypothetical protein